jgi:hypothetical protein
MNKCEIAGLTNSQYRCVNLISLLQGPRTTDWTEDMDNRINWAIDVGHDRHVLRPSSLAIIVTGWRAGSGHTNTVRVISVPERSKKVSVVSTKAADGDDEGPTDGGADFF